MLGQQLGIKKQIVLQLVPIDRKSSQGLGFGTCAFKPSDKTFIELPRQVDVGLSTTMRMLRLAKLVTMPSPLQDPRINIFIQFKIFGNLNCSIVKVDYFDGLTVVPMVIEEADIAHVPPDLHRAVDAALADYGPRLHRIQQGP